MSSSDEEDANDVRDQPSNSDAESEEDEGRIDPLRLPPSSFSLPDDEETFELWTIRMPTSVDHTALNGIKVSLDKKVLGMVKSGDQEYGVVFGESAENDTFRVLVEGDNNFMVPATVPFAKHLNVVHSDAIKEISQTDLAPGVDRAPTPIDPLRKAYSIVPPKTGLKRRWMPSGAAPTISHNKSNAQNLVEGLVEYHARRVHKVVLSGLTGIKDDKPFKSPPTKRRRPKDLGETQDNDQLLTQESPGLTKMSSKLERTSSHSETETKTKTSSVQIKEEDSHLDDSEKRRSAKKAKNEAKEGEKMRSPKIEHLEGLSESFGNSQEFPQENGKANDSDAKRSAKKEKKEAKKAKKEEKKAMKEEKKAKKKKKV